MFFLLPEFEEQLKITALTNFYWEKIQPTEFEQPPVLAGAVAHPDGPIYILPTGRWQFWERRATYHIPEGLTPEEVKYVSFFMYCVMPKLEDLYRKGVINFEDIEFVLRAASM